MQTCMPSCVDNTNKPKVGYANGCKIKSRKGGIPRLTFLICDPDYVHPNAVEEGQSPWENLDNVKAAMCAGLLNFSGEVLGSKPKGSFTKRRMGSCSPEETIGGTKPINFQDYNSSDDLIDFDFWSWVQENRSRLKFGWISCDDLWYQFDGSWDLEIDQVADDNSEQGKTYYDGVITTQTEAIIKPISVPGLLNLLENFEETACY